MSLNDGTFKLEGEGRDPYARDYLEDEGFSHNDGFDAFNTAAQISGPVVSIQLDGPQFMDIVAAQGTGVDKPDPEAQVSPAVQAGIDLDQQVRITEREIKPIPEVKQGVAFSRTGQGAERVDNEITRQEEVVNDLEGAINDYVALNPDTDPEKAQPAEPGPSQSGLIFSGGVAGAALSAVVPPVMPAVRAAVGLLNPELHGAGSFVSAFQTPQHSGSEIDKEAGYGAAPSAPSTPEYNMATPVPAPSMPVDVLPGTIEHIVEPGLDGMKPGRFEMEEVAQIKAACMDLRAHVQDARTAMNTWQKGPVQAADWADVKELKPEDLELKDPRYALAGNSQPVIAAPRI